MCKEVEATQAEMAGVTEAEGAINHPINNTRKIRNVSIAIRRDINPTSFPEAEKDANNASSPSQSSQAESVTNLNKDFTKTKKKFT